MTIRIRLVITGRVQGVGFRYWAHQQALRIGLSGWVKNQFDGSVECECQGEEYQVEEFILICSSGPARAHVSNISQQVLPVIKDNLKTFQVR